MLIEKGHSDRYDFGLYTIQTKDGDKFRFHGTTQLDSLLSGLPLHAYVKIEHTDIETLPQGEMKLFTVHRKKE